MIASLKLDGRLRAVVDNIQGRVIADIGCEHGKVAVCALAENRAEKAIACDISSQSLAKAVALAKKCGIDNIEFRCGDGFEPIADGEADCAVIAGMGGKEIMSILSNMPAGIERLILVAHKNTIELREFLSAGSLYVEKDFIVGQGGKFYSVIVAASSDGRDCRLSEEELYLGKNCVDNPDFVSYLEELRQKFKRLEDYADKSKEGRILRRIFEIVDTNAKTR
ncbi:MAG: class I SAM-dependent methyltransferase [Clostridia bacterium]|nr:class I SAM-dependent methyltransferase [Clostridia bacterium]